MSAVTINELAEKINKITEERGWTGKVASTKNLVMALIVEAAELVEIFQWVSPDEEPDPGCVHESSMEVADIFIYLLRICQSLGIDILDATRQKLEMIDKRPMGYENEKGRSDETKSRRRIRL